MPTSASLFLGSPAFIFLLMLLSTIIYNIIAHLCQDTDATHGGLIVCLIAYLTGLLFYARSLHFHARFSRKHAYWCVAQALLSGLLLGVPILVIAGSAWNAWRYLDAVLVVTLLVVLAHDVFLVGLFWKKLPLSTFFQRGG